MNKKTPLLIRGGVHFFLPLRAFPRPTGNTCRIYLTSPLGLIHCLILSQGFRMPIKKLEHFLLPFRLLVNFQSFRGIFAQ
jgi:hypothetical protein